MSQVTPTLGLVQPDHGATNWDLDWNANAGQLDTLATAGRLMKRHGVYGSDGAIDQPKTTAVQIHRLLAGSRADLTDNTDRDLLVMTFGGSGTDEEVGSLIIDYAVWIATAATPAVERGQLTICAVQDSGGNRVVGTVVKANNAQALDAGIATLTVTGSASFATNVLTVKLKQTNAATLAGSIHFTARVVMAIRSNSTAVLAAGVTAAT